jgi:CarD family transcriptional regulator
MGFAVGSTVIYPAHGAATVVERRVRTIDGVDVEYLELSIPKRGFGAGSLRVSVPEANMEELGVRHPISVAEADDILDLLAVQNVRVATNWSRRFKNHQAKLKSGDIYECAEVVRNLTNREAERSISTAEKAMKLTAEQILASELAITWGTDIESSMRRVATTIMDAAKAAAPAEPTNPSPVDA